MTSTLSMYGRYVMLARFLTPDAVDDITSGYLALTRTPAPVGANGLQLTEPPVTAGYKRYPYPLTSEAWQLSGFAVMYNAQQVLWSRATANWGLITGWAFLTAQEGGDLLATGTLVRSFQVLTNAQAILPVGAMQVSIRD